MPIRPRIRHAAASAGLVLAVSTGSLAVLASPAAAALGNCAYPYVCVYDGAGNKLGQFRDFTSYFQGLSNPNIRQAYNTRNDDVAYFRYPNGQLSCIEPRRQASVYISGYGGAPNGIRITTNATCTFPPPA